MDRNVTLEQIRETLAVLDEDWVCVYLFGSAARGTNRSNSDLDLAVLLAEDPQPTLDGLHIQLADVLTEATGRPVDLVVLNRAPVDLIHRVLRDGVLVLDRDPSARIRFEVKARNEYFDLFPYLEQYRNPHRGAGGVTDADLIAKKLAFIETCVRELREIARPERIGQDLREERFIAHTLQLAIQATQDVASHIVSDRRLGEPATNRQLFELLARDGWLTTALAPTLGNMAGFRNILVHGYQDVENAILRDVAEHRLEDLLAFVEIIRGRLSDLSDEG